MITKSPTVVYTRSPIVSGEIIAVSYLFLLFAEWHEIRS